MAYKRTNGRRCRFESLENRRMMAGLVTAQVTNSGTLLIKGDFYSNAITITPGANKWEVVVTGVPTIGGATSVNGVPNGAITIKNVTNGLQANMGLGNDEITINNLNNNNPLILHAINGKTTIKTGGGLDSVQMNASEFNSAMKVKLGTGATCWASPTQPCWAKRRSRLRCPRRCDANRFEIRRIKVALGKGNDNLIVAGVNVVTKTTLNGGRGIDQVTNNQNNFFGGVFNQRYLEGGIR